MPGEIVTVTIGGEAIRLPPLTFGRLKQVWPAIIRGQQRLDRIERTDLALELIFVASGGTGDPAIGAAELGERLLTTEMEGVLAAVPAIMAAGGLLPADPAADPGEATAASSPPGASTI